MPAFESKDEKVTSRRERRKDARRAKRQQRLESWATHQSSKHNASKKRKAELALKQEIASQALQVQHLEPGTGLSKTVFDGTAKEHTKRRVKGNTRKRSRAKFEEFLESENQKSVISAEDDLTLERRLGKKLKVKEGLLRGSSDGMSELLDGLISSSDILEDGMDKRTFPPGKLAKMEVGDRGVKKEAKHSSSQDRTAGSDERDDSAEENASEGSSLEEENLEGSIDSMAQSEETSAEDRNGLELISEAGIAKVENKHVNCSEDTHSKEIPAKYVAPHLRVLVTDSNEVVQVQRRIRGLLNRLSEGNVESIADEFSSLFQMEFMLETICEIKNNRKRAQLEPSPHLRLKKWLQKLRVEDVQIRALTWKKLLHPDKKGQWWISGGIAEHEEGSSVVVADIMDKDVAEAENLLQLAASQRMNTDIRKAIFCVIMSGEDYLDAFEKILRLKLSGK